MYLLIVLLLVNFLLTRRLSTAHSWQRSVPVHDRVLASVLVESTDIWKKRVVPDAQQCRMRVLGLCFYLLNAVVFAAALCCRFGLSGRNILPVTLGGVQMTTFGQLLGFFLMAEVFLAEVLCMIGGFLREDYGSRGANIAVRAVLGVMMVLIAGAGILMLCFLFRIKTV